MSDKLSPKEAIRKRPSMYIGRISDQGLIYLIKRIITQVIVEHNATECQLHFDGQQKISITFNNMKGSITAKMATEIKEKFAISILNYLSEYFKIIAYGKDSEVLGEQTFVKGELENGSLGESKINCSRLKLESKLDHEIWQNNIEWNYDLFNKEINEFAYLNKSVKFKLNYQIEKEQSNVIYAHRNGLTDWLNILKLSGYGHSYFQTYLEEEEDSIYFEIAFAFRELSIDEAQIKSFVNDEYTHERGSHVDGLLKGVTNGVMKYFQKHGLVNNYKISEKGMEASLIGLVNVKMADASFSGCVKSKLANPEIIEIIAKKVANKLFEKMEDNEQVTERLIRRFEM